VDTANHFCVYTKLQFLCIKIHNGNGSKPTRANEYVAFLVKLKAYNIWDARPLAKDLIFVQTASFDGIGPMDQNEIYALGLVNAGRDAHMLPMVGSLWKGAVKHGLLLDQ
jgi:hypothetical protein